MTICRTSLRSVKKSRLSFVLNNSPNLSERKISTAIKYSTSGTNSINPDYEYQYQEALNKKDIFSSRTGLFQNSICNFGDVIYCPNGGIIQ